MNADQITFAVWVALMAAVVAQLIAVAFVNRYLRQAHAETWETLGSPTVLNNSVSNNLKFLGFFIFSSRYQTLDDRRLNRLIAFTRTLMALCAILFAIFMIGVGRA